MGTSLVSVGGWTAATPDREGDYSTRVATVLWVEKICLGHSRVRLGCSAAPCPNPPPASPRRNVHNAGNPALSE